MARTFSALRKFFLPSWMLDDEADGAFARTLAGMLDEHVARMRSGMEQRFPSRAGAEALALCGADRLIVRGRDETAAHYAARLRAWRYPRGHRVRGNVFALLEQIAEYFGGGPFVTWGVDRTGNRRYRDGFGAESFERGDPWVWDSLDANQWSRQWIVISNEGVAAVLASVSPAPGAPLFRAQPSFGDAALWGGALSTPGYCVGIAGTTSEDWRTVVSLTRGPHRWLPAGVRGEWIIVVLSGAAPTPDATYAKWGKLDGTSYVASRASNARYVALRSALLDYAGDTDFAVDFDDVDGGTIAGDATSFPATITLPDATAYAGDVTDYPETVRLVDDGGFPS